jgi:hypothetical protein
MTSLTPTLLDPYEVSDDEAGSGVRRLPSVDEETLWFDRASLDFDGLALIEEISEAPPWTPEPVDRRWRGRTWAHDE